jgi:hypothetical protein
VIYWIITQNNCAICETDGLYLKLHRRRGAKQRDEGAEGGETYGRMRGGYFSAPETRGWPDVYHLQLRRGRHATM